MQEGPKHLSSPKVASLNLSKSNTIGPAACPSIRPPISFWVRDYNTWWSESQLSSGPMPESHLITKANASRGLG